MGVFDALRQSASAADIRILHGDFRDCNDENNESLVVYVRHAGRSFLFAGDAEWEDRDCTPAIQNMLARFTGSAARCWTWTSTRWVTTGHGTGPTAPSCAP